MTADHTNTRDIDDIINSVSDSDSEPEFIDENPVDYKAIAITFIDGMSNYYDTIEEIENPERVIEIISDHICQYINDNNYQLPSLERFVNLKRLNWDFNNLQAIPILPEGLIELSLRGNDIKRVDTIPSSVRILSLCDNPNLTFINESIKKNMNIILFDVDNCPVDLD